MTTKIPARTSPFILSATVDFPDDVIYGTYTPELLNRMMVQLKEIGVTRIYWLYYGDVEKDSYWAGGNSTLDDPIFPYGQQTFRNIGEPLKAAVPFAHAHGLEIYGVLKPYNGGAACTYPEGASESGASNVLTRIGGPLMRTIPFLERYPDTRVQRRPIEIQTNNHNTKIRKIRLLKKDDSPTRVRGTDIQIWTSESNFKYKRKQIDFTVKETVEPAPREVRNYYGDIITKKGAPVRILTIEGLNLSDQYIAITTGLKGKGDFVNTAVGMVEAYGDGPDPLWVVVATRGAIWVLPRDFREYGLDFDCGLGTYETSFDDQNNQRDDSGNWKWMLAGGVIAFARGKNEYLAGTPCEAYPEVRRLWSGWAQRIIDSGVDGIDVRISAHGSLTNESSEYGYNKIIVDEFKQKYGKAPDASDTDMSLLAELRGEHFTSFIRETSKSIRSAGGKMQVHVHTEAFRRDPCHGQMMGFPDNIRFDWKSWVTEGLLDGVTFRTSWFEGLEDRPENPPFRSRLVNALDDPYAKESLATLVNAGIPAYLNRYFQRSVGDEEYLADLENVYLDERFAGFDLYEFSEMARANPEGTTLNSHQGRMEMVMGKAKKLGLV
tara:strand:- start:1581 stop:3395 length:1815 start_codon:yes stop_codon:yes gene_type:complete